MDREEAIRSICDRIRPFGDDHEGAMAELEEGLRKWGLRGEGMTFARSAVEWMRVTKSIPDTIHLLTQWEARQREEEQKEAVRR